MGRVLAQVVVNSYKVDLKAILHLPATRAYFREHLKREFAVENLEARLNAQR